MFEHFSLIQVVQRLTLEVCLPVHSLLEEVENVHKDGVKRRQTASSRLGCNVYQMHAAPRHVHFLLLATNK